MLQQLLNFLDALGRFPHENLYAREDSTAYDVQQWKAENLFKVWSPKPESPWFPYAKATLFASADSNQPLVSAVAGVISKSLQDRLAGLSRLSWVGSDTAIIADLPRDESVILAAYFAERYGFQPVALFNNWPHSRGLVNCEVVLTGLIALAPQMAYAAAKWNLQGSPFFMAESSRLGNRQPNANDFDNRYFLSEEDLPPAAYLRQHGVNRLYYINRGGASGLPGIPPEVLSPGGYDASGSDPWAETDDLNPYLCAVVKEGIELFKVPITALDKPESFQVQPRKTVLSSFSLFENSAFRRAAAGGFGALVPPRSSGG